MDSIALLALALAASAEGGGATSIDLFVTCSASEYDDDHVPIYSELVKRIDADKIPKLIFLAPSKTEESHLIGWRYDTTYEEFDPFSYADFVIADFLKAADHKANETALTFTDSAGTSTTVYVHTENA